MRILIACEDLRVGGAQVFTLRLANALRVHHTVILYSLYSDFVDQDLVGKYAPGVAIRSPKLYFDQLLRKVDRLLYLLKIEWSIRDRMVIRNLAILIKRGSVDIVHSNMFKCDYVVARALQNTAIPLVITMHGNYEEFLANYYGETKGEIILGLLKKVKGTVNRIQGLVYLTEKNLRFNQLGMLTEDVQKKIFFRKIYYGFAGEVSEVIPREALGIAAGSTVYGFVARGIPEKGWKTVLDAFLLLKSSNDHLVLVGWSDYVKKLASNYHQHSIHFVGYSSNPLNWMALVDVGLLPSVFHESLPNVITEYLFLGKAVICTDVGDSANMIAYEKEYAGFVLNSRSISLTEDLAACLNLYKQQPELLGAHQRLAKRAFQKFKMEVCLTSYLDLYNKLVNP